MNSYRHLKLLLIISTLYSLALQHTWGEPIIESIDSSGILSWTDSVTGGTYRIEWASSLDGDWTNGPFKTLVTSTSSFSSIRIPMFYRIIRVEGAAINLTNEKYADSFRQNQSKSTPLENASISTLKSADSFRQNQSESTPMENASISTLKSDGTQYAINYVGWLTPDPEMRAYQDQQFDVTNYGPCDLKFVHTNAQSLGTIAFNDRVGSIIINLEGTYYMYYAPSNNLLALNLVISSLVSDLSDANFADFECLHYDKLNQIADIKLHFDSGRCVKDITVDYQRGVISFTYQNYPCQFIIRADSLAERIIQTAITAKDLRKSTHLEMMAFRKDGICIVTNLLMFIGKPPVALCNGKAIKVHDGMNIGPPETP